MLPVRWFTLKNYHGTEMYGARLAIDVYTMRTVRRRRTERHPAIKLITWPREKEEENDPIQIVVVFIVAGARRV